MHFRVMIKKSILRILPFGILVISLLNWILSIENPVLRLCGISVSVLGYSVLFILIEYLVYKQSDKSIFETVEKPINHIKTETETSVLEELPPVEEENEFGELLEVEAQAPQPVEFISSLIETKQETKVTFTESDPHENIEELEVIDESVEELEAIDE